MANKFVVCEGCKNKFAFHQPENKDFEPNFKTHGFTKVGDNYFCSQKCLTGVEKEINPRRNRGNEFMEIVKQGYKDLGIELKTDAELLGKEK